ncbi:unnamed protein product [Alternaria sp. RS040]
MATDINTLIESFDFEEEITRAVLYARSARDSTHILGSALQDKLDSVSKLEDKLKNIKLKSPDILKIEIEAAGGLTSYWDRLDREVSDQSRLTDEVQAAKSAILAVILRVLGSATKTAEWLKSEIDKEGLTKYDSLLFKAAVSGTPETVDLLLLHGADLLRFVVEAWDEMNLDLTRGNDMDLLVFLHVFLRSLPESVYIEVSPRPVRGWESEFPYLVLTTIDQQVKDRKERKVLEDELSQAQRMRDALDLDLLGRTLDEAYYPGLAREALDLRNQDQVVSQSKDTFESYDDRERQGKKINGTSFILMVPQLWLYKLGGAVVSSYTMPHGTGYALDGYDNELTFERRGGASFLQNDQPVDAEAHLGLIMTGFIERFGEHYTSNGVEYSPPLDLFETRVVGILSEVTNYVKKVPGDESNISKLDYRRERYFIHVISDVRSELAMIKHVLEQQERVLKQFLEDCLPANEERLPPNWVQIKASQETIKQYMKRVEKIDGDADRIEKNIQDMLNLKRTHASIRDAHSSLILSTAVIGFTVITIVFTPLAFLTALFALKIDGFERLQISGSDGVFHSGKIGGIFVSTEILTLVLTGIAVWLAFKYTNRDEEHPWKEIAVGKVFGWVFGSICALLRGDEIARAWFKSLIARLKNLGSKERARLPDPESPRQDNLPVSTKGSLRHPDPTIFLHAPQAQDESTPIRSTSVATWPEGRKDQLKHLRSTERTKTPDLESLRQFRLQGAIASPSKNPSPATAARRASTG